MMLRKTAIHLVGRSKQLILLLLLISFGSNADVFREASLPSALKHALSLSGKSPYLCIESVDEYLNQYKKADSDGYIVSKSFGHSSAHIINGLQIKSICNLKLGIFDQAQVNIESAIEQAKRQKLDLEVARSLLIYGKMLFLQLDRSADAMKRLQQASLMIDEIKGTQARKMQLRINLALADFYTQKDVFTLAKSELETAKNLAHKLDINELSAWVNFYWGRYYVQISQPQLALRHFVDAKSMAESTDSLDLQARATHEIADIYMYQGKLEKALHYANQSSHAYQQQEDQRELANSLIYLATLHRKNQEFNLSLVYFFNALDLLNQLRDIPSISNCYLEMGKTYLQMKNVDLARNYLNSARASFQKLDNSKMLVKTLLLLGQLNIEQGEAGIAIIQLERAMTLTESLSLLEQRERAYELLAAAYELTGHYQKAIENFKYFHALQTKIKQLEFNLEQNKFNEQYQLIERTQQITVLEQENLILRKEMEYFIYGLVLLGSILLIFSYRFTRSWFSIKRLRTDNNELKYKLTFHSKTGLLNWSTDKQPQSSLGENEQAVYYALVNLPFLTDIYETHGALKAQRVERELGSYLQGLLTAECQLFQVRDNQLLYICSPESVQSAEMLAEKLIGWFDKFQSRLELDTKIAIGIVGHPFLPKAPAAIDNQRVSDLACLALLGASQLMEKEQTSSWVELYAIDCPQAAFFNGDIWLLGQQAIAKGLVKINASGDKNSINWPILQTSYNLRLKSAF